ncbi:MAG: hypothetical protein A3J31_00795 [Candidatus Taylorbacteria bacterium RIFCSPLOWO2_02_FULL_48_16]|nr:MAG: hypothetical protein A3J31_00795 [Candidatus Taylorbacteria bacterium RIFCSPLOWO2_02_FULL_48_16]
MFSIYKSMIKELKKYQETAVDELILKSKLLLNKNLDKRTIVFQSPTGSGKTFMMSQYIIQLIEEMRDEYICFLWLSPGKGKLHEQSFKSLKKEFAGFPNACLLEEEFFGSRKLIDKNEVVVGNWEKLSNKDSTTGEWKSKLMKDKETTNFRELITNTKKAGLRILMIIDESHSRDKAERAFELRKEIINPDLAIEMSATPILHDGQYNEKVSVEPNDVIEYGMIKKEIIINENIDKIDDDEITSQELVMEMAYRKRLELKKDFEKEDIDINPLVLVQIPDSEDGNDKKDFVENFLGQKGINKDNHKLAVWLNEEKVNQEAELITKKDNEVEFLIFKKAVDTGWDCPRAQILVKFRETKSLIFEIQTVGRILRMPETIHYKNDNLNRAYVYTNVKSFTVAKEKYNPNIIKSIFVKRESIYGSLKLKSYYRNRIDYGDITFSFNEALDGVFCRYFGITRCVFTEGIVDKNKKKLEDKKVEIGSLEGKEEIILNKQLDTGLFDHLSDEVIKSNENFQSRLSADDKERVFENVIKENLNGYAPKRSKSIVKNALYNWFKKYIGVNLRENGIIYVQNVILNNYDIFGKLFDQAIKEYQPIKDKEIKDKIKEVEEWNTEWEIAENRNYNQNIYKAYNYKLSVYKQPCDKKTYLDVNPTEESFIDLLEENNDKISWWWQNGSEHMALNFGIKYGNGSTFQPDFLVMFKNGKLGIFDTKAVGQREEENKLKAEALQKYIKEEIKRKKKEVIFGGLVIKEGSHFRINSDDVYKPFALATGVKEKSAHYGISEKSRGWQYFKDLI